MKASEIAQWALDHGFRKTGNNAYSATFQGDDFQIVLRPDGYRMNRVNKLGGKGINHANTDYDSITLDEHGMIQGGGLAEAFVRRMWRGEPAPVWFTPEFTRHSLEVTIPGWEAKLAAWNPTRGP